MNFVIPLVVCAASIGAQADERTYDINGIRNIMSAWAVDADENVFVKYKTFYVDEEGKVSNQKVITHVLYDGSISVQKPKVGTVGIITTWVDDTAILYTESTFVPSERVYQLKWMMESGEMLNLGFTFTGFIGLDPNIRMQSNDYPSIADRVLAVTQKEDEISITILPAGATNERQYSVMVVGASDQRIRRVEAWYIPFEEDEQRLFRTVRYQNWKSVNGQERPTTMTVSFNDYNTHTQYEIVEIRPSVHSDLGVIPPSRRGDAINDSRAGFVGSVGDTRFAIDSFHYRSSIPISGPPLNFEAVLAASTYAGGKPPQIGKPRRYLPNDAPHQISLLGENVTIDVGEYDMASGDRTLVIPLQFTNTSTSDIPIAGWKTSCGNVRVTPQEAVISPGEQLDVEVTVSLSGGDNSDMLQPILVQGDEASTVQLTYRVESTYSTHVLNSVVRLDEEQKGTLKLICISPFPPNSVVSYSASEGIEGTFSGWTEVNPKDKSPECLGKLWRSSMEVTGTAVKDSWILLRTQKQPLGLFPVISNF